MIGQGGDRREHDSDNASRTLHAGLVVKQAAATYPKDKQLLPPVITAVACSRRKSHSTSAAQPSRTVSWDSSDSLPPRSPRGW